MSRQLIPFYRVVIEFRTGPRVWRRKFHFLDEPERAVFIEQCRKLGGRALRITMESITTPDQALWLVKKKLFKPQEGGATVEETSHDTP